MKQLKWLAVYTRPNREKQVADLLQKKGIETYAPYNQIYVKLNGRVKVISEPLFRSNIFICLPETKQSTVLRTRGVINFLYWHGSIATIKNEEIQAIKEFLTEYQHIELKKIPVNMHSDVEIVDSPLLKRNGNVLEVLNSTVKLLLPSFGYALVAETRKEQNGTIVYRDEFRVRV